LSSSQNENITRAIVEIVVLDRLHASGNI
jgi:hypothetical protein